ncbi:DNA polymerase Y family protein [Acetobacter estunensis]|uniref:DNA-directed DNA polymerase n=1 Tax=Acetobacter estunensis TaxID=104097 RepID=A0A967BDQ6_9PROT|nr:DNA polymerase Y family protein [Acetobacter estunensis]
MDNRNCGSQEHRTGLRPTRRITSIWLPLWATDRLRREQGDAAPPPETPLVLAGRNGRRRVVFAADRAARKAGLVVGMPVAKAQVLLPGLSVMDARPDEDRAALERLALWLQQRVTPIVALNGMDGLILDTTGADHLLGGEAVMLRDIVRRLEGAGISARAAVADTLGAAYAVTRTTSGAAIVVPPGEHAAALADMPVAALRLPAETVIGLADLGLTRIRDIETAPRAPLVQRFGAEITRRLDQAYGRVDEPILPIRPADPVAVSRNFAEPIAAAETIARYIGKLVPPLCASLEERGLGARRLDLLLHRVDSAVQAVRVALARPVRDPKHLLRLLSEQIEIIEPGFGIERMDLVAVLAEPMERRQQVSSLIEEPEADLSGLIDMLANRLGDGALYRVAPVESDVPERSVQRVPPLAPVTDAAWPEGWPRPTRLLPRPEPIETMAMLPDHPPVFFVWRGIRRKVKCADGRERVFGEWWKGDTELTAARDYFQVEDTSGERFWIYRAGDGEHGETGSQRWFLHGLFA